MVRAVALRLLLSDFLQPLLRALLSAAYVCFWSKVPFRCANLKTRAQLRPLVGKCMRLICKYVFEDGPESVTHFDRKHPLDAARKNVARQFRERDRGQHLCGVKVGTVCPNVVLDERSIVPGIEEIEHATLIL